MKAKKFSDKEKKIMEKKDLFKAVFEHAPDAYYINDLTGKFVDGNKAAEKLTGFKKSELVGKDFLRCGILPADQIPRAVLLHARNIRGKSTVQEPLVLRKKNGELVPVEISTYPVRIGKKTLVLGIARDVSEKQKSIQTLRESEYKYRQLFEHMSSAFAFHKIIIDENGKPCDYEFIEVNSAFEKMLGIKSKEIIGKRVTEIFRDIKAQSFDWIATYGKVALTGEPVQFEASYGSGAEKRWFSVSSYSPFKDYFVAIFSDITERRELESALFHALENSQKREREISEMLAGARYALSGADLNTTISALLESLKRLTGAQESFFVLEKEDGKLISPDRKGFIWEELKKRLVSESGMAKPLMLKSSAEMGLSPECGCVFTGLIAIPIISEGKIKGAFVVYNKTRNFEEDDFIAASRMAEIASVSIYNREVEERLKNSIEQLKELDFMKNNFMSMVSHELRTPFTAIKGFLKILMQGDAGPLNNKQKEYLDIVVNNSERLLNLINDLLDMAKVESGVFIVKKEKNDLIKLFAETMGGLESIIREKEIEIEMNTGNQPLVFYFDYYRMSQVIINLLNNAIKVSPKKSKITITAGKVGLYVPPDYVDKSKLPEGGKIMIKISDQGVGLKAEECPKIFDKFYQVVEKGHMGHKGTGLGLSITKGIVEAHGGIIWAESEGPGKGATFTVIVPEK